MPTHELVHELLDPLTSEDIVGAARCVDDIVTGYVFHRREPQQRYIVELLIDGLSVAVSRADRFDFTMPDSGVPRRDYGFAFDLQRLASRNFETAEIRVANTSLVVARLDVESLGLSSGAPPMAGAISWIGGMRFAGWLAGDLAEGREVRGFLDGACIVRARTSGPRLVEDECVSRARVGFDFHLPDRFADGRARRLEILNEDGEPLYGSPVEFVAFADGFEDFLHRLGDVAGSRIDGALRDRLFPRSVPFSLLDGWTKRFFPVSDIGSVYGSVSLALVGERDFEITLASLGGALATTTVGVLPSKIADGSFHRADLEDFVAQLDTGCTSIVFALGGTRFADGALLSLVGALREKAGTVLAYCDVVHHTNGERTPLALPSFDYERLLEQGYATWCFVMDLKALQVALAEGADSLAALFFHGLDSADKVPPRHVAGFGATLPAIALREASDALRSALQLHLQRRGTQVDVRRNATARLLPSLRVQRLVSADTISVVIATRDEAERLRACVGRIAEQDTRHKLEIVIADMGSTQPDQIRLLHELSKRAKVIRLQGLPGSARALNRGALEGHQRLVLFMEACVQAQADLVEEMASRCADGATAACGATLLARSGVVQSMGLVLAFGMGAAPACRGFASGEAGYADMLSVAQQRSALAGQCLMVKRSDFESVGGFDEAVFARFLHAADLSLKLSSRGRRLVVSPHALAINTRPDYLAMDDSTDLQATALRRERELLRLRWGLRIGDDPFYSPLLADNGDLFSALAWPPRLAGRPSTVSRGLGDAFTDERIPGEGDPS